MHTALLNTVAGFALALALLLSCSDDAMDNVDAQGTCDCPAAEPPLAGRIVWVESDPVTIRASDLGDVSVGCPDGAMVLGGSCDVVDNNAALTLNESRDGDQRRGWGCTFRNPSPSDADVVARAVCLVPPAE